MKTQTEKILNVLRVIAWIGYIGWLIIFAVVIVMSFFAFLNYPSDPTKLPTIDIDGLGITFQTMKIKYPNHFIVYVGIIITETFLVLKIWEVSKNTLSIMKLNKPFSKEMAIKIERIAWFIFGVWVVEIFSDSYNKYFLAITNGGNEIEFSLSTGFSYLYMAGIIYLISQIFKRGVELQEENELTV
ncbi:MAG: DUF2975 domain-containing protein [Emticicia sp.]|uniref:DUF2975 domain-containing protein n=1 Tax=Emticicia sp. TaxID=1930953 RepID=UPI003BA5F13C